MPITTPIPIPRLSQNQPQKKSPSPPSPNKHPKHLSSIFLPLIFLPFLTGEHHRYSRERGVFQRVIPKRPFERGKGTGFGAWEAAIGYSMLDLNQKNIAGGRGEELALGLNWYLTRNAKLQLNVLPATLSKPGFGESNLTVAALRAQVEF